MGTDEAHRLDSDGRPIVAAPAASSLPLRSRCQRFYFRYIIIPILAPFMLVYKSIKDDKFRRDFLSIYKAVNEAPRIQHQPYYQPRDLIAKLWKLPSAQHYVRNRALEYQNSEGYCGRATLRVILQSFGGAVLPSHLVPPVQRGETKPEKWCEDVQQLVQDSEDQVRMETDIVRGDVPYTEFLRTLERIETSPNDRVALNYLRPVLFGFAWPKYFITNFILGVFGGHFSPVVGIIRENQPKDNPLIGVFDVNHKYNGAYFVPAQTLHESVKAKDLGNSKSRALVVVTIKP